MRYATVFQMKLVVFALLGSLVVGLPQTTVPSTTSPYTNEGDFSQTRVLAEVADIAVVPPKQ